MYFIHDYWYLDNYKDNWKELNSKQVNYNQKLKKTLKV